MNYSPTFFAFYALLERNMRVLKDSYWNALINSCTSSALWAFVIKLLLPALGMRPTIAGPLFLGSVLWSFIEVAYNRALAMIFDLYESRTLNFYLTLPIQIKWVLSAQVISLCVEIIMLSLPNLLIGLFILNIPISLDRYHLSMMIAMYFSAIIFFAWFTLLLGITASRNWYLNSVYPQLLVPMTFLGCMDVPWSFITTKVLWLKSIFLISPLTYIIEGLRATMLNEQTLSVVLCIGVISLYTVGMIIIIFYALKKRHDYYV